MKHSVLRFGVLFFAILLFLTSCNATANDIFYEASSSFDYGYYNKDGTMFDAEEATDYDYVGNGSSITSTTESLSASQSATDNYGDRKIIRNATLSLETKLYDEALASIDRLVAQYGGYVESSQSYGTSLESSGGARQASYTLRIPADAFDSFLNGIEGCDDIFNIIDKNEYANDITSTYYDVEARLTSLLTQEERLLAMLDGATELQYMLELEQTLADVRYQIESYYSQIKRYDSQVSMSTVDLFLREVIEYQPVAKVQRTYLERLGDAFVDSWEDFVDWLQDISIGFIYMLPGLVIFAVFVLMIFLIIRHAIKKHRKHRTTMIPSAVETQETDGDTID